MFCQQYLADQKSCLQSILAEGGYHPSINDTMVERVNVPYSPQGYPPPYLQAQGYRCACGQFYDNACRSTFRQVAAACTHMRLCSHFA